MSSSEEFDKFQKEVWSSDKPLLYAIAYVEQLMIEKENLQNALLQVLQKNRDEFIEDVRSKVDFSNFEK